MRVVAVLLLVTAACRTAPAPDDAAPGAPPAELGVSPVPVEQVDDGASPGPSAQVTSGPAPPAGPTPPTTPTPLPREVGAASDPSGDAGLRVPGYADLVSVTLFTVGDDLRVLVTMAAEVPDRLSDDEEVLGVGVDLHRGSDSPESDYQLFADGGAEGWLAYLATPDGFVRYPGRFAVDGRRIVFRLPWTAVGDLRGEAWRVFADWTGPGVAVPASGSDRVPNRGRGSFRR